MPLKFDGLIIRRGIAFNPIQFVESRNYHDIVQKTESYCAKLEHLNALRKIYMIDTELLVRVVLTNHKNVSLLALVK